MKARSTLKSAAFTLFEVLIALGIFAVAVVGLMSALNMVLDAAGEVHSVQAVRAQMENRIAVLEAEDLKNMERSVVAGGFTFKESIQREEVAGKEREILNGFWRVKVIAEWESHGKKNQEEANFLRYGP